jgi:hypothetical protein
LLSPSELELVTNFCAALFANILGKVSSPYECARYQLDGQASAFGTTRGTQGRYLVQPIPLPL